MIDDHSFRLAYTLVKDGKFKQRNDIISTRPTKAGNLEVPQIISGTYQQSILSRKGADQQIYYRSEEESRETSLKINLVHLEHKLKQLGDSKTQEAQDLKAQIGTIKAKLELALFRRRRPQGKIENVTTFRSEQDPND